MVFKLLRLSKSLNNEQYGNPMSNIARTNSRYLKGKWYFEASICSPSTVVIDFLIRTMMRIAISWQGNIEAGNFLEATKVSALFPV